MVKECRDCWGKHVVPAAVLLTVLLSGATQGDEPLRAGERVDFSRDVRRILSEKCFRCHGPDAANRKAELRLDDEASTRASRGDGPAAVQPGDHRKSGVWLRISSEDDTERMPPPDSGLTLTAAEIQTLRRWIDQGGRYSRHWSLEAPVRPRTPQVRGAESVRDPIDAFVLQRLEQEGLVPATEAPKATLLRRVTLYNRRHYGYFHQRVPFTLLDEGATMSRLAAGFVVLATLGAVLFAPASYGERPLTRSELVLLSGGIADKRCSHDAACNANLANDCVFWPIDTCAEQFEEAELDGETDICATACNGATCTQSSNLHPCWKRYNCIWNSTTATCERNQESDSHSTPNSCNDNCVL